MAFTSTITMQTVSGNKRVHRGTWTTDTTGGNIDTGLSVCEHIVLTPDATASPTEDCEANETFPCAGSAVTIVVTTGVYGIWEATGH